MVIWIDVILIIVTIIITVIIFIIISQKWVFTHIVPLGEVNIRQQFGIITILSQENTVW